MQRIVDLSRIANQSVAILLEPYTQFGKTGLFKIIRKSFYFRITHDILHLFMSAFHVIILSSMQVFPW